MYVHAKKFDLTEASAEGGEMRRGEMSGQGFLGLPLFEDAKSPWLVGVGPDAVRRDTPLL